MAGEATRKVALTVQEQEQEQGVPLKYGAAVAGAEAARAYNLDMHTCHNGDMDAGGAQDGSRGVGFDRTVWVRLACAVVPALVTLLEDTWVVLVALS